MGDNSEAIVYMTRWLRPWCTICWWAKKTPALTGIQRWTGEDIFVFSLIHFSISRYGPMGIGYAPNKEQYTEHFLKPLRAAFSERDLQVFDERRSCVLRVRVEMIQVDITWHDDIYRLIWSPAKDRTVGLWAGFMVVIQVVIIIMSWLLSQWSVTLTV